MSIFYHHIYLTLRKYKAILYAEVKSFPEEEYMTYQVGVLVQYVNEEDLEIHLVTYFVACAPVRLSFMEVRRDFPNVHAWIEHQKDSEPDWSYEVFIRVA